MSSKFFGYGLYIIATVVFVAMLWLCLSNSQFIDFVVEKSTGFISFMPFAVSAYSGYGLTRLAVFDKLEELKEQDAAKINAEAAAFRKAFEDILIVSISCGVVIFLLGFFAAKIPVLTVFSIVVDIKVLLGFSFSFSVSPTILLLFLMRKTLDKISNLREKVISLSSIEKKRKALLTEMYEQAEKNPFNEMDFHLKKYRQVINND